MYQVPNVMDLDPLAMSCRLNERPATVHGKLVWPDREMLEVVWRGCSGDMCRVPWFAFAVREMRMRCYTDLDMT